MIYKKVGLNTYISTKLTKSKIVMRDKGYYIINKIIKRKCLYIHTHTHIYAFNIREPNYINISRTEEKNRQQYNNRRALQYFQQSSRQKVNR